MARYTVLVADPSWRFGDKLLMSEVRRGSSAQYATLTHEEIKALPVASVAADDAVLALWCPAAIILEGDGVAASVCRAWGFEPHQIWTWVKTTKSAFVQAGRAGGKTEALTALAFGMGRMFRGCTEFAVIARRGRPKLQNRSQRGTAVELEAGELDAGELSPALRHSAKPETLQDSLELMYPKGRFLELFARRQRPGWRCTGLELDGEDVRTLLPKLAAQEDE